MKLSAEHEEVGRTIRTDVELPPGTTKVVGVDILFEFQAQLCNFFLIKTGVCFCRVIIVRTKGEMKASRMAGVKVHSALVGNVTFVSHIFNSAATDALPLDCINGVHNWKLYIIDYQTSKDYKKGYGLTGDPGHDRVLLKKKVCI